MLNNVDIFLNLTDNNNNKANELAYWQIKREVCFISSFQNCYCTVLQRRK